MNALPKPNEFIDIGADVAGIREALVRRRRMVIGALALLLAAGFVTAMLLGDFPAILGTPGGD